LPRAAVQGLREEMAMLQQKKDDFMNQSQLVQYEQQVQQTNNKQQTGTP
jgi:hypothetical protein